MYGDGELFKRAELHRKANNVGTSGYQTFLTDPQPEPAIMIRTPHEFIMGSCAKPIINGDSVNYVNQRYKLLGGIVGLNPEELKTLIHKHTEDNEE